MLNYKMKKQQLILKNMSIAKEIKTKTMKAKMQVQKEILLVSHNLIINKF